MWVAGAVAVAALLLFSRGSLPPYDDALFFSRFAHNFVEHGVFAWTVEEGALHGNTSQLWQGVLALLHWAVPGFAIWAARLVAVASLLGGALLLGRHHDRTAVALAFASPVALATGVSGMETAMYQRRASTPNSSSMRSLSRVRLSLVENLPFSRL